MKNLHLVISIVIILTFVFSPVAAISKSDLISQYKGQSAPTMPIPTPTPSPSMTPTSQMPSWLPEGWIPPTTSLTPKKNAYDSGLADPTVSDYPDDTPLNCSGHTRLPNVSQVFRTPTPTPTPTISGDFIKKATPRVISDEERKEIWDKFYRALGW